ncbi:hypothetical protein F0225_17560 [Vibrio pectenicida]|uniref:VspD n=1 Tax=Vibrio pectenicida TaxID=62763 RepID=A0A7Y4EEU5_9VIBR|nr:type III secretion system translocon subunit SctE [Vibrio pectenicida]NOH73130.1 hypothetical protein [Vibrio pectenicida]
MSTFMNTISATTYVAPVDESTSKQPGTAEKAAAEQALPGQPLPGSSITLSALWRLLEDCNKEVAEALSQTGAANSEAKKSLIDIQRDSTVASIRKQSEDLQEQQKANKKRGIFAKIGMALGVLAAVVSAVVTFGATAAAVAVAIVAVTLVLLPTAVDKILEKCGVPEEKRNKIKMGLEIACAVAGLLIAFNPAKLLSGIGQAATKVATKATTLAKQISETLINMLTKLKSVNFSTLLGKSASSVQKATKLLDDAIAAVKAFKDIAATATQQVIQKAGEMASKAVNKALEAISQLKASVVKVLDTASEAVKSAGKAVQDVLTAIKDAVAQASKLADDFLNTIKNLSPANMLKQLESLGNKVSEMLVVMKSLKPSQLINKAKKMLDDVLASIKDLGNSEKIASRGARVAQVTEVTSTASDIVGTGFGIKSSKIAADMEKAEAEQNALQAAIQQILLMLSQAMRAVTHAFETMFDLKDAHSGFDKTMLANSSLG